MKVDIPDEWLRRMVNADPKASNSDVRYIISTLGTQARVMLLCCIGEKVVEQLNEKP